MAEFPREAIILAGGLGTRLRSVLPELPKPMAPIHGRPFLDYLIGYLARQGIERVVLSTGYRHETIAGHFGHRWQGVTIDYSIEESPLGTGGGLARALDRIDGRHAFALNGDTFVELDYRDMAARADEGLLMAVRKVGNGGRFGACIVEDGRLVGFTRAGSEGETLINAGVYLLPRHLLAGYGMRAFSFEQDFLEPQAARLRPLVYPTEGRFIDIGIPDSYRQAEDFFAMAANTERRVN